VERIYVLPHLALAAPSTVSLVGPGEENSSFCTGERDEERADTAYKSREREKTLGN